MTTILLLSAIGVVALSTSWSIADEIRTQAIQSQNTSLRVAATVIARDLPGTSIAWNKDGNVDKIVMAAVPGTVPSHDMIDSIGRMTGQTATIFGVEPGTRTFVRRTTNILKQDRTRAVGTQLDPDSAAYAAVSQGRTYRGTAVILGTSYYTTYQPIVAPDGAVVGVLYVGVRSADIDAIADQIASNTAVTAAAVMLAAIAAMTLAARTIMGPIPKLTSVARELAGGRLDIVVPSQSLGNEIGALARTLDVLRQEAAQKKALEAEAVETKARTDQERSAMAEIERAKGEAMAHATAELATGLHHLAQGNLCFQLSEPLAAEFEALRADFNAAMAQLAGTLRAVADATGTIDSGSRGISSSGDDISRRTERQAAALEETAAALDEITANVASSSRRADEARTIAAQASASAAQSGKVVADAVQAMGKIEDSSREITSIIGVIDEIAFQTNLLALNAGVEAARAGESGRGFAVVAQEVRELAQRSARAASEIKELIRKSTLEVETGVKLVSDTGQALSKIEAYIVTVDKHVDAIATAAREQSIGLVEVNTSVNGMDQATQQNAAMAEQTSTASATLAAESRRLRDLVGQFQLEDASRGLRAARSRSVA